MKPLLYNKYIEVGGEIHLALDTEHLACHAATSDAADSENDESLRWLPVSARVITCRDCVNLVKLCRGVRVPPEPK